MPLTDNNLLLLINVLLAQSVVLHLVATLKTPPLIKKKNPFLDRGNMSIWRFYVP